MSRLLLCAAMCLPLLAGCSSLSEPAGISYAKAAVQAGINPVYPPREDIQVGDIYAIEAHSAQDQFTAKSALIAYDDLTDLVRDYLASRYKLADTLRDGEGLAASGQQDARGKAALPAKSDLRTLPLDGLADIEFDSGITLGISGQPSGLSMALGFSAAKTLKTSLKYRGVSSYEIPIPLGLNALRDYCQYVNFHICQNHFASLWINQKFQLVKGDPSYVTRAGSLIITKVYLARQIIYTFNDATLAAAVARSVGKDGSIAGAAPVVTSADIAAVLASGDASTINAATALLQEVNNSVTASGSGQGAFSFAYADKNIVAISEVFDRPVVVGYEGASWDGSWPDPPKTTK